MTEDRGKLLFVDDDPRILRAMAALFRDRFSVETATDGNTALDLLDGSPVDVVISDQRMPGMQGVELLRRVRRRYPATMRILLTGYSDWREVVASVNEGEVYRFVAKPWNNTEFRRVVKEAARLARVEAETVDGPPKQTASVAGAGVVVLTQDAEVVESLQKAIGWLFEVHAANSTEAVMRLLSEKKIGVVVAELSSADQASSELLIAIRRALPTVVTVALTEQVDAPRIVDLINRGQVYRLLLRPIKSGAARLAVQSAVRRHAALVQSEGLQRRTAGAADDAAQSRESKSWLGRLMRYRRAAAKGSA